MKKQRYYDIEKNFDKFLAVIKRMANEEDYWDVDTEDVETLAGMNLNRLFKELAGHCAERDDARHWEQFESENPNW